MGNLLYWAVVFLVVAYPSRPPWQKAALAALRNKSATVHNVALVWQKCRNGCAQGLPFLRAMTAPGAPRPFTALQYHDSN
jgi:hypothetical protein